MGLRMGGGRGTLGNTLSMAVGDKGVRLLRMYIHTYILCNTDRFSRPETVLVPKFSDRHYYYVVLQNRCTYV